MVTTMPGVAYSMLLTFVVSVVRTVAGANTTACEAGSICSPFGTKVVSTMPAE